MAWATTAAGESGAAITAPSFAASRLRANLNAFGATRKLWLLGKSPFSVSKDRPFVTLQK
jgi:hypothetical protein